MKIMHVKPTKKQIPTRHATTMPVLASFFLPLLRLTWMAESVASSIAPPFIAFPITSKIRSYRAGKRPISLKVSNPIPSGIRSIAILAPMGFRGSCLYFRENSIQSPVIMQPTEAIITTIKPIVEILPITFSPSFCMPLGSGPLTHRKYSQPLLRLQWIQTPREMRRSWRR